MQFKTNPGNRSSSPGEITARVTRLPLEIDDEIIVRSLSNMAHRAKSRIIGAVHGEFVLIREPVVKINERISTTIEDDFMCHYFKDGSLYNFQSRTIRYFDGDIVSIQYPREIELQQVRRHRRIRVNIETEFSLVGVSDSFFGDMIDISQGGCRLVLHALVPMVKGTSASLSFSLPNEEAVERLRCSVMSLKYVKSREITEIGVSFSGPAGELQKIIRFCDFCMFFDVE